MEQGEEDADGESAQEKVSEENDFFAFHVHHLFRINEPARAYRAHESA
jgi:hypothetical protein